MKFLPPLLLITLLPPYGMAAESSDGQAAASHFFENKIRPILARHCHACHSEDAKTLHGGLRLDTARDLAAGGDSGPVVVAGKPNESPLIEAVRYQNVDMQMPPVGRLSANEVALLVEWVQRGAFFPSYPDEVARGQRTIDFLAGREFWSFQPATNHRLPPITNPHWPRQRIDWFILARLESHGLEPSTEADRRTLLRRLSFDLTGLPPSPDDLTRYLHDNEPGAYRRQVDRLLQSPHFGERWARVWLDLARYTDKTASWLQSTGQAHLYRDWVVSAMNADMPYPAFVRRQLATDLDPATGLEDLPALGFLGLSPNYWKELKLPAEIIKVIVADEWEERVDAVSRTFLGLTVACARCHDHKFDPISAQDYYALAGVFASSRLGERALIDEQLFEPVRRARASVAKLEKQIADLKQQKPLPTKSIDELTEKVVRLRATPHYDTPMANVVIEQALHVERAGMNPEDGTKLVYRDSPRDLQRFIRGNPNRLGERVPRRFLEVFADANAKPFQLGSGRLELAQAITGQAAHLTARVIVNRIWLAHFGRGLVTTPSNFGGNGERPSHPQLLDDLTARFMANGWSLKQLHREIVLSATYRQSSRSDPSGMELDAENRWLWRMNRRPLDVEAWRDAMLMASQELDRDIGGRSIDLEASHNRRRTLYATVHRREMSGMLLTHDFPSPAAHSPRRQRTTTPLQGLFALNGPLLARQAKVLARHLNEVRLDNDSSRIRHLYNVLFLRSPTAREVKLGLEFLEVTDRDAAWEQYAHVLLASNEFRFVD